MSTPRHPNRSLNPLCWLLGHKQEGCLCDGNTCDDYDHWCPAEHCRRVGCTAALVPLPRAKIR